MSTSLRWTASKWRSRCLCSALQPVVPDTAILPKPRLDYNAISESIVKYPLPVGALQSIARTYAEQKELSSQLSMKRHLRSTMGDRIRITKDSAEKQSLLGDAKTLKAEITRLEVNLAATEETLLNLALQLRTIHTLILPLAQRMPPLSYLLMVLSPKPASAERDHTEIGRALGLFDFESAAVITGSSWYYLLGEAALLEDIASRCGFQPRDQQSGSPASQTYFIADSHPELVLSGTAEIPLAGMFANKIFPENTLPMKVVGLGRAFRAEAGSRGTDTRGLYRVHQFTKVELFAVCEDDDSERIMEEFRRVQTEIFEGLGIPFRVLDMPTEELGASAFRKYDMEAWMPGRGRWGEISSTSNCTDYQARRLHIRYRRTAAPQSSASEPSTHASQSATAFAHTLNGTAAAIPRLILALVENGARFNEEGKVVGLDLPNTLKPYWLAPSNIVQWF
ncbi:hypothetical protein EDC04DRAFT_2920853 [Pisolithus marmoratus]|nr:hypothetical protein EDC04DRAFT_2920853 [Pisolithus marmoratus]